LAYAADFRHTPDGWLKQSHADDARRQTLNMPRGHFASHYAVFHIIFAAFLSPQAADASCRQRLTLRHCQS